MGSRNDGHVISQSQGGVAISRTQESGVGESDKLMGSNYLTLPYENIDGDPKERRVC